MRENVGVFRGSETDLVARYVGAAKQFGLDTVARVTADCPFVDAELFVQAEHLGFRVKEIPVPFVQRQLGASHIRRLDVIAATMLDMAKLRLTLSRRLGRAAPRRS